MRDALDNKKKTKQQQWGSHLKHKAAQGKKETERQRERERGRAQCSVDMKSGEESGVFIDKEEWAVSRIII